MPADAEVAIRLFKREVDSWRPFIDALREDDRKITRSLLVRCERFIEAIESSRKTYVVEPLFLSIVILQEERISALEAELRILKEEAGPWKKGGS
jgi:hypothetical protein